MKNRKRFHSLRKVTCDPVNHSLIIEGVSIHLSGYGLDLQETVEHAINMGCRLEDIAKATLDYEKLENLNG